MKYILSVLCAIEIQLINNIRKQALTQHHM